LLQYPDNISQKAASDMPSSGRYISSYSGVWYIVYQILNCRPRQRQLLVSAATLNVIKALNTAIAYRFDKLFSQIEIRVESNRLFNIEKYHGVAISMHS